MKTRFAYLINTINISGAYWIDNTTMAVPCYHMTPLADSPLNSRS